MRISAKAESLVLTGLVLPILIASSAWGLVLTKSTTQPMQLGILSLAVALLTHENRELVSYTFFESNERINLQVPNVNIISKSINVMTYSIFLAAGY